VRDEQLHGPLQSLEQLAHAGLVLRAENRHPSTLEVRGEIDRAARPRIGV
jgi:hypothetical protein